MNAVLKLEYTCLFTDLDTVWFKPAVHAMSLVLDQHDADMVGMNDKNSGLYRRRMDDNTFELFGFSK